MRVRRHLPDAAEVDAEALVDELLAAPSLPPFAPPLVDACAGLSAAILAHPRARLLPELVALAFSLRPAELARLQADFEARARPDTVRVPRGLVLHLPPGNVDTLAFSTWALSLLAGNRNLVRLSQRGGDAAALLLALWADVLAGADPTVRAGNVAVATGHDTALLSVLSAQVDARLVWGGDAAVRAVRQVPLAPRAVDLAFPDRSSLGVWSTAAFLALDPAGRQRLVEALGDDLSWFGQQACASPRWHVWVGPDADACAELLWPLVRTELARRGTTPSAGALLERVESCFEAALDPQVQAIAGLAGALSVITLGPGTSPDRGRAGTGLLQELNIPALADLGGLLHRKDQTVTTFGFDEDDLRALARALAGRGGDRFVPVGQALRFESVWDGVDLLEQLTRHVTVRVGR
ncbi:MAG: gamma-glutamyl phosphate reductase [Alphaproteobacteria bacterium]|nr:gamma-glutamyl phosphate reductase [Alphaproteobacteria bacterium]